MLANVRGRLFRSTLLTDGTVHTNGNPLFLKTFETFLPLVVRNTDWRE
jgi:hypothetical protein